MDSRYPAPGRISILYGCQCGKKAPLSKLFFSEDQREVLCRRPTCSLQELESYYCPHRLTNLPSKEAESYHNRSSRTFCCPDCDTVLQTVMHDLKQKYFLFCPHCRWDSLQVGLLEEDQDTLLMSALVRERESEKEDVFEVLESYHSSAINGGAPERRSSVTKSSGGQHRSSTVSGRPYSKRPSSVELKKWSEELKQQQKEHQMRSSRSNRMEQMGTWKVEDAMKEERGKEERLIQERSRSHWPSLLHLLTPSGASPPFSVMDDVTSTAKQHDTDEVSTLRQRLTHPDVQPRDTKQLLPSRPLLRVKRTWRSVTAMERGSAGILVKPQITPMTGDSSLPGQLSWFKKASLASRHLPVFTFMQLPHRREDMVIELRLMVENFMDESVRMTIRTNEGCADAELLNVNQTRPIAIGAYEDPSIVKAFNAQRQSAMEVRHGMVVGSSGNLVELKMEVQDNGLLQHIRCSLAVDLEELERDKEQVVQGSAITFPIELIAPITNGE